MKWKLILAQDMYNRFQFEIKPKKLEKLTELELMEIKQKFEYKQKLT